MTGGFFGYRTVIRDYRKQLRTGKVVSGTLKVRTVGGSDTFNSITWNNLYIHPQTEKSGYAALGLADTDGMITLYRTSESEAPRADDQIVVGSNTYLIQSVTSRLNADETNSFAVYDCAVTN